MKITPKQLKNIIQEEIKKLLSEGDLTSWAQKSGVGEDDMYDMLMIPNGIDMLAMLMNNGFQLQDSDDTGMTWVAKTEDDGMWAGETIQLKFTVPKDNEKPSILYRAGADRGFLKTNPFETTFDNYEETISFVNTRFAGQ
jgi:hypothetical protein